MKICVFGAASDIIKDEYKEKTYDLASRFAKLGHSLVFGAGGQGLMGAAADGFYDNGGHIHGIIPRFFAENGYEKQFTKCDKLTLTDTMAERKFLMEEDADAFVIVPGGVGTLEEFFQVLTLKQLNRHQKPIVIYNIDGFYDSLDKVIKEYIDKKFINVECLQLYAMFNDPQEVIDYLDNYTVEGIVWNRLKNV